MRHRSLALLLTLASSLPCLAAPPPIRARIVVSEVLGLLYFAESLLGTPHRSPYYREVYDENQGAAAPLTKLRQALASAPSGFRFYEHAPERPTRRELGSNLTDILEAAATQSRDLDDFGKRTLGLLPVVEHARMLDALAELQPLYLRHVWVPSADRLDKQRAELDATWSRVKGDELVTRIAAFYGSEWPAAIPFTIALVPVPHGYQKSISHAHSSGALEVVEVLEGDDMRHRFGVVVHEMAHSFFHAQPISTKLQLEHWISASKLPTRDVAYASLDEAMATAIGNGWAATLATGKREASWYNDAVVDRFAKDIFADTRAYLERGRRLDGAYLERALAAFDQSFPNAHLTPAIAFQSVLLIAADGYDLMALGEVLRKRVAVHSLWRSSPVDHPKTKESYARTAGQPCIFVLRKGQFAALAGYAFQGAVLPKLTRASAGSYYLATEEGDGRLKVLVIVDGDDAAAALDRLSALPRLTLDKPLAL
jgi:hypothetical protein